jgi:hypothetical protein
MLYEKQAALDTELICHSIDSLTSSLVANAIAIALDRRCPD